MDGSNRATDERRRRRPRRRRPRFRSHSAIMGALPTPKGPPAIYYPVGGRLVFLGYFEKDDVVEGVSVWERLAYSKFLFHVWVPPPASEVVLRTCRV